MTHNISQSITIVDPREFDGDPYQVAERALLQAKALADLSADALEAAEIMARNAELERELANGDKHTDLRPTAAAWPESPQGRLFVKAREGLNVVRKSTQTLAVAAAFNPKSRIRT